MELLTVPEAAALLRISEFTTRKLLREGKLPGRKVGREWRIVRADLEAFLRGSEGGAKQK